MALITALRLPIDWTVFGWGPSVGAGRVTLHTGEPGWAWDPGAPAFSIPTMVSEPGKPVDGFWVDHIVLLVPDLQSAVDTLERVGVSPRLRMPVGGRPAAFFRAGPVLEVIESPVRDAALYGVALATDRSLEALALEWKALGLNVGKIGPAIQKGRRIMTVHDVDAGLAVMSRDAALHAEDQLT
ncbi:MAG: VOC family protein [Acidimicrobiia bacterium]